jgi:uncharacterized protein DUF4252
MRKIVLLVTLAAALPLSAQRVNLDFPGLAAKATETVDVTLDGDLLKIASKFLDRGDPDERAARDIVSKLEGIYVRSYTFEKEGEYDRNIAEKVRSGLGASWKRIVTVKSREHDNVEIYVEMRDANTVRGLVIISAEPRELTLVNLVGPVDIDKLSSLEGEFGIPRMSKKEHHHE